MQTALEAVDLSGLTLSWVDVALRMLLAMLIGAVIGTEREYTHRPAGMRTHMLVALGACAVMITSQMIFCQYRAYGAALGAACILLSVWAGFCLLWGVNYWTDSFQDKSGIYAQPVALEDLREVTAFFADRVSETAGDVRRDGHGLFAVPREEILANSVRAYDGLTEAFPFLAFDDPGVKPMAFSRLMSALDFTGFYSSFTGESNVNVDSPACMLPSTIAHELAHQRGFASEQECNFLAVLASTTCTDPAYRYSGWLIGYVYLGNALYSQDPEGYWAIRETLAEEARLDLAYNNAYWAQFQNTAVQKASNKVYDGILKSYGDERGIQSYGTVVDLLVVYYK